MGKRVPFLAILALAGLVGPTGCGSSSGPSDGQARKVVETSYQDLIKLGAKIIDFRKLNGEAKVIEGQKTYVYHFLVAFELPAGIWWRHELNGVPGGFEYKKRSPDDSIGWEINPIRAGATGVGRGTITFRETERGWTDDLEKDDGYCPPKTSPQVCYNKLGYDKLN
jgi:hypothetical protein